MDVGLFLLHICQGAAYLAVAPVVVGTLGWARARLQRRQGHSPLQSWRDLFKLVGKRPVLPDRASWVFTFVPVVVFTCYALPGFLLPVFCLPRRGISFAGDLLLLVYLLGLARMAIGLAGLDAGAPFGNLGSSRELFVHILVEPSMLFLAYTFALKTHTTDLALIIWHNHAAGPSGMYVDPPTVLLLVALATITLLEAGRLPFDNPHTNLELTMFGRAITLEYAGPQLALLEWAEALRLTLFITLLSNLSIPWLLAASGGGALHNTLMVLAYPAKLLLCALGIAFWETLQIKTRLRAVMTPALVPPMLTLVSAILIVVERYFIITR